ncbi:MAG: copper chaperone PCu(A)C [Woeseiaceae bacterium]|nr:copper chaperone PCu(A)C [Woeseiaceae bacterium]
MMRVAVPFLVLFIAACGQTQPPLVASGVDIARPMPGMKMGAAYFVLTNNTDEPIRITSVTSPQFAAIEIHETRIEDGIARMREIDALVVPPRGTVTLERGGKHLMLMRPGDLGDVVTLLLMSDDVPVLTIDYAFATDTVSGDNHAG